ncbi:hypothetical protein PanWU01x14_204270 [Parasponia andersonii]|uniref:Uncharacterized protein n=1 Tax=Parasponia andersonii TaxID=3476 RepID=A0A2P5BWM7_PARAD|nr:hypothetical protein PanWU01x14_204270 [Parasponia andersonii]
MVSRDFTCWRCQKRRSDSAPVAEKFCRRRNFYGAAMASSDVETRRDQWRWILLRNSSMQASMSAATGSGGSAAELG